jgi:plasmid stability protein
MPPHARQYTIRNVPDDVDRKLRQRAKLLGRSFNEVALEALAAGSGLELRPKRDLSQVVGSLTRGEADRIDDEIRLQRQVDAKLWR